MKHRITLGSTTYTLTGDRLRVNHRGDVTLDVCLSPVLDGREARIGAWQQTGPNRYQAPAGTAGTAFLAERFGKMAFWVETPGQSFANVTYLSNGRFSGAVWRSFVSDEHARLWDKKIETNIPISSAYADTSAPDTEDKTGGMTDPTDCPTHWIWNMHVRALALRGRHSWLGLSVPGPWGIGITRLAMHRERFNLRFEQLNPGCTNSRMPVVYFCPGLDDAFAVLDEHRELSEALGLMDLAPKTIPPWWTNPWFGYYDEMQRCLHNKTIQANSVSTIELMKTWVAKTRELLGTRELNINMEQGCFRLYGDYRPAEIMGTPEEVRAVVDAWRRDGVHVGHYIHPFVVNTKIPFYHQHPEAFCQPKEPDFFMEYPLETWDPDDPKFAPIDWTHPKGREYMLGQVELLISAAPGCMNFDILRSNHWRSPDPRHYDFHDPDWGIGDMMTYKVQKLMYDRVKSVKPEAMVTKVAALDCTMQPTFDAMQISEDWTHSMEHWYRRSRLAARVLRNTLIWVDPWFVTRSKGDEYHMGMLAWTLPETQWLEHAPHCYYPRWCLVDEKRLRRRKAGFHAYLNARPEPADVSQIDWSVDEVHICRRKTSGPLAGFYGGLALSPRCFVTYNESEARIASSEARLDWIPLPPGATLRSVTRLCHDGREEPCEHVPDQANNRLQIAIEDCGGEVLNYRIRYEL